MRFAAPISALAFGVVALAQDQTIHVGNNGTGSGLFFSPQFVNATANSTITFVFDTPSTNHTVAQSSFAKPCEPLANGFDSGYTPGAAGVAAPTWNLTVTDASKPIWFYCAQPTKTHCIAGMVGGINVPAPPATNDGSAFIALATGASSIVQPVPALSGIGAFASAAPSATAPASSGSGSSSGTSSGSSPSSTGNAAAAVGVSGGFVAALAAVFGVALL
ncbi:hypothetical protein BD311DRAFT_738837 [Dichomitus squalens]|uniref:Cupredoxin n=1 Tax=Dichomitus squalens TaxID=114155 RepID=A0A4Q9MQ47_9APHY|nr:hypothetical protein BD311DRAFT_738837 [Dichomitus squalens]